jgi:NAD(P)-dependent dehydrogenase (short-subunit alcohol dehydrogenase family)
MGRRECDVESEESIAAFMSKIGHNLNTPLHLVNATGVSVSAMIHKAYLLDINRMLRVNLVSNILLLKHARELYKEHGGTFTMISSIAASDGPIGTAAYAASKAGLRGLMKVASKEFARLHTRVNMIECGYLNTGMISQVNVADIIPRIPLGCLGNPADVAQACRFLIQCSWVTGCNLELNGGMA